MWQDIRHGLRMLAKAPGFAALAMLSIGIGVGANAAMFGVADTMVLRPLTMSRANELVTVTAVVSRAGFQSPSTRALSYPDFVDIKRDARSFSSLFAYRLTVVGMATQADQPAERTFGMAVSGNFFDAIGVQPALGRARRSHAMTSHHDGSESRCAAQLPQREAHVHGEVAEPHRVLRPFDDAARQRFGVQIRT